MYNVHGWALFYEQQLEIKDGNPVSPRVLSSMDRDKDNVLSLKELKDGVAALDLSLRDEEVEGVFSELDKDKSGTLNLQEFFVAVRVGRKQNECFRRLVPYNSFVCICFCVFVCVFLGFFEGFFFHFANILKVFRDEDCTQIHFMY